ncbi:MAG: hypothetical protein E6Q77_07855 [Rhizobium sp.]|nr:MAG: hypothetical protein E6Q77_07855 [Rhizobium sp.]
MQKASKALSPIGPIICRLPPSGGDAARTTRETHDERRSEILLIRTVEATTSARLPLHLPALLILPALPIPVRTVPLPRIKAKKIPIVQPILTFSRKKSGPKIFID